jgi:transposase InsO family protein
VARKGGQNFFRDENGFIYRREKNGEHILVVPACLISEIQTLIHDSIYAAHPGRKRMLELIGLRFWWTSIYKDVNEYVFKCGACERRSGNREFKAPLDSVTEPTQAFQCVHLDVVGPLPLSSNGNNNILTLVDRLNKYAEGISLPDDSAVTCAKAYATQIVARHGVNESLVMDNGRNFTSVFFKETCNILGVNQLTTTVYHPQANGTVERLHRTLNKALSCFNENQVPTGTNYYPSFF